ncbi:MAG: DUF4743 domain-containing protein, partial [Alphaproteobacteria bacterium]|nr:DUF4743 domain-containing protein [Alphaproteobacteria bacterium]
HPGLLDHAVAGFLPVGESPVDKLSEEAVEEAGLGADMLVHARPVGSIHFVISRKPGLQRGSVYIFDLEIGPDTDLENRDGEIEAFLTMPPDGVVTAISSGRFKFDSALVATDFLLRHGCIEMDDPSYLRIGPALNSDPDWSHRRSSP